MILQRLGDAKQPGCTCPSLSSCWRLRAFTEAEKRRGRYSLVVVHDGARIIVDCVLRAHGVTHPSGREGWKCSPFVDSWANPAEEAMRSSSTFGSSALGCDSSYVSPWAVQCRAARGHDQ